MNYVDPTGMLTVGPVNGGQLGVVTVRADAGPDWTALWELWMFGMQMNQRLLPPLIDGPGLTPDGGGGGAPAPQNYDPLPTREGTAISNALAALIKALSGKISKNCQKNVIDKLAQKYGFSLSDFVSYLGKGANFYNGLTSQAPVAGTITTPQAANAGYGPGATIASVFNDTSKGLQTNALTSITSPTLLVFLRPDAISTSKGGVNRNNLGLLFHEGLHGYGGTKGGTSYFDQDLKSILGLKGRGSGGISDYIGKNCF